ncbi:GNAT family N-acetyltransferase [bacterium]|nr:GNAT family N-acetyltransferase [bacterium]MCB2179384.1 GNAT family N-acetyltransferase [bacterium]
MTFFQYNSIMAKIEIKPLTHLDVNIFQKLASGYTSQEKYLVGKSETNGLSAITLELQPLKAPFIKHWDHDPDLLEFYQSVLEHGLSLGCYMDSRLVGIAIAEKRDWNRSLWVWEFHVDPGYRYQGLGSQMVTALANLAQKANCRVIVCETQNTNVPAIRFYRKNGFEIGGVDLSYYTNHDMTDFEVAIFMKLYLPSKKP